MAEETESLKSILDSLDDGVYYVDKARQVTYWNSGAERITGYSLADVLGRYCWDDILGHVGEGGCHLCVSGCALSQTMDEGRPSERVAYLRHKEGHRIRVRIRVAPIRNGSGEIIGAVQIFSKDFSEEEALQRIKELERMAYLDELTGLAKRRFVEISLQMAFSEMQRYGWPFGIVMMDVDGFKEVNDLCGHCVGDEVLKVVARTLAGNSRPSDVIGRWGGDEFLAVLKNTDAAQLERVAEKYRCLVNESRLSAPSRAFRVSLSTGVAAATAEDTPVTLLQRADACMYRQKGESKLHLPPSPNAFIENPAPRDQTTDARTSDGRVAGGPIFPKRP